MTTTERALSSFASAGGCACKLGQDDLRSVLAGLPDFDSPDLLVGHATNDDAAVLRIEGNHAIVQTVDYFTPIVDDPELFGAIAAANAISDVYAMGAVPVLGLALAMFPTGVLSLEILAAILRGGAKKAAEARFPIAGGHTIIDDVPKYGLCVTGTVDVDRLVQNSTAQVGDVLYLTKPIGNGMLVRAYRAAATDGSEQPDMNEATEWMTKLNRDAARAMLEAGPTAATDVTGYGLVGHLLEVCRGSRVGARIDTSAVPLIANARDLAARGVLSGGTQRNCRTFRAAVESPSVDETTYRLMCDAQTSGGLLIALRPERAAAFETACRALDVFHARIGETTERSGIIELM